jgi:hypothetical protein
MTHDAALCVAMGLGLAPGIGSWKAGLTFQVQLQHIVWNVENTTRDDGMSREGDVMTLHAITGELLGRSAWSGTP